MPGRPARPMPVAPLHALAAELGLDPDVVGPLHAIAAAVVGDPHAPTAVRDPAGVLDRHLADSLVALALPEVRGARAAADLGAGAGFPGLALAAALPACAWALVESVGRKASFLRAAAHAAGLGNVTVIAARAEDWREGVGTRDLVTARALAPLPVLAEYAAPLLRIGGHLVAWKGRPDATELEAGARAAGELGLEPRGVHGVPPRPGAEQRTLHLYMKVRDTPDRFPRRAGMARKRPLGGSG